MIWRGHFQFAHCSNFATCSNWICFGFTFHYLSITNFPSPAHSEILCKIFSLDLTIPNFRSAILCEILEPDYFVKSLARSPILQRKFESDIRQYQSNLPGWKTFELSSIAREVECWFSEELYVRMSTSHHFQCCHKMSLWAWNLPKLFSPSNFPALFSDTFPILCYAQRTKYRQCPLQTYVPKKVHSDPRFVLVCKRLKRLKDVKTDKSRTCLVYIVAMPPIWRHFV